MSCPWCLWCFQDRRLTSLETRLFAKIDEMPQFLFTDKDALSFDLDAITGTPFLGFGTGQGVGGGDGLADGLLPPTTAAPPAVAPSASNVTTVVPPTMPAASSAGQHIRSRSLRLLSKSVLSSAITQGIAAAQAAAAAAATGPSTTQAPVAAPAPAPLRVPPAPAPIKVQKKRVRSADVMLDLGVPSNLDGSPVPDGAKRHHSAPTPGVTPVPGLPDTQDFEALHLLLSQVPDHPDGGH